MNPFTTMVDDTLKLGRDWQSFWEARTAQMLDEAVKSQQFVQAMTRSLEQAIDGRKLLNQQIDRIAEVCQLVTRKDLDTINRQLFDQSFRLEQVAQTTTAMLEEMRRQTELLAKLADAKPRRKNGEA